MAEIFLFLNICDRAVKVILRNGMQRQQRRQCGPRCTEVRFASFISSGFITAIVVNQPEKKLAKSTSLRCSGLASQKSMLVALCGMVDVGDCLG